MLKLFTFLCFVIALDVCHGLVVILRHVEKPPEFANLKGCYVPYLNKVLPYNEPYSPTDGTRCVQYICQESNVTLLEGCSGIAEGGECKQLPGNKTLPYPECCRATCPKKPSN